MDPILGADLESRDKSPTLRPEWLNSSPFGQDDTLSQKKASGRKKVNHPGMLNQIGRSRSSPTLLDETVKSTKDVFSLIKEKTFFETNFPDLPGKSEKQANGMTPSAWKQSAPIEVISKAPAQSLPKHSGKPLNLDALDVQLLNLVPSLPKPRNLDKNQTKGKMAPDTSSQREKHPMRKTISDSSLNPENIKPATNRKLLESKDRKEIVQNLMKKEKTKSTWKNLDDTFKSEIQAQKEQEPVAPEESVPAKPTIEEEPTPTVSFKPSNVFSIEEDVEIRLPARGLSSSKKEKASFIDIGATAQVIELDFDQEAKEITFLRELGWLPEAEEYIPELTPEEINSVQLSPTQLNKSRRPLQIE